MLLRVNWYLARSQWYLLVKNFFFFILLEKALLSVRCSYTEKARLKRTTGGHLVEPPHRAGSALNPHQVSQGLFSQILKTSKGEVLLSFGAACSQGYPHSSEVFAYTQLGASLLPCTSTGCFSHLCPAVMRSNIHPLSD